MLIRFITTTIRVSVRVKVRVNVIRVENFRVKAT